MERHEHLLTNAAEISRDIALAAATIKRVGGEVQPTDPFLAAQVDPTTIPPVTFLFDGMTWSKRNRDPESYRKLRSGVEEIMPDLGRGGVGRMLIAMLDGHKLPSELFEWYEGRGLTFRGYEQVTEAKLDAFHAEAGAKTAPRIIEFFGRLASIHTLHPTSTD
jgi:hypothetical protein